MKTINVQNKITGQIHVAVYTFTPSGNLRYNVDGKFYTDKKFDQTFKILSNEINN